MAKDALQEEKDKLVQEAAAAKPGEGEVPEGDSPYRGSSQPDFDEEKRLKELVAEFKKQCEAEREEVLAAGGLKIVGTERHESRRIDRQLRGRAGRQGDPGSSQFFISLEDDLMRLFGSERIAVWMDKMGGSEEVLEHKMLNKSVERAQKKVEENNYILLDNFVQSRSSSSSSGSKKASLVNSKRSKTRMSMKRLKKSGALNLPQHLQK